MEVETLIGRTSGFETEQSAVYMLPLLLSQLLTLCFKLNNSVLEK